MICEDEFGRLVDLFIYRLDEEGIWDEKTYTQIKFFILEDWKINKHEISLSVSHSYYRLGLTISYLSVCNLNKNDVYTVDNLSEDEFSDKRTIHSILMNIRYGVHDIVGYEKYLI